jgi:hypothetical protein
MSSKHQIPHSILRNALKIAEQLPPLKSKKNPAIAAAASFCLGALGSGLYLRSWPDVYIPVFIFLVLVILSIFTAGIPLFFIPFCWAVFAWKRVQSSNRKLEDRENGVVDAEIITPPPIPAAQRLAAPPGNVESRLRRLDQLFQAGMLTPGEREAKRREILTEI